MKGGYNFLLDKLNQKVKQREKERKVVENKSMKRGEKMTLSNYYKYNSNAGCRVVEENWRGFISNIRVHLILMLLIQLVV